MCSLGKMQITNVVPADNWAMVFFETLAGKRFHVIKLAIDPATAAELIEELRPILNEYGL
jgi:hypothetical protein